MTESANMILLYILGKPYKVKCPPEKVAELREAAEYLEEKMRSASQNGAIVGADKLAIIAGLNAAHELLAQRQQIAHSMRVMDQRIQDLHFKIDEELAREPLAEESF